MLRVIGKAVRFLARLEEDGALREVEMIRQEL
jgi:hypothetical protein